MDYYGLQKITLCFLIIKFNWKGCIPIREITVNYIFCNDIKEDYKRDYTRLQKITLWLLSSLSVTELNKKYYVHT